MLILVIILIVFLIASVVFNVILYKSGVRHLESSELLSEWISDFKFDVLKTYNHMKLLDDREMFSKDDDVGIVFRAIA